MQFTSTSARALGLLLLLFQFDVGYAQESTQGDQPTPDSVETMKGPLHEGFRRVLRKELEPLPRFLRDAQVELYARTYYFDRDDPNLVDSDTLAQGAALVYRSGWARERFSFGADLYTSQRISGENEALTLLLDGDDGFTVLGQAYGQLRFDEQYLTLYRQRLDLPYVNARDSRMIPSTFEAYTIKGEVKEKFQYIAGHVTKIKPRNADEFISMSERAGAGGSQGLSMAGLLWSPREKVHLGGINHFVDDTLNVLYLEGEYTWSLTDDVDQVRVIVNYDVPVV